MISVTLQFTTIADAAAALGRMSPIPLSETEYPIPIPGSQIAFEDRPDVGAPLAPALPLPSDPASVFGVMPAPAPVAAPLEIAVAPASPMPAPSAPAPVAAPIAPTTQVQALPLAATGAAPTLDKDGVPWDGRIHGSTKSLNADGTWRRKRNTADAEFEAIKTQLLQASAAQAAAVAPPVSAAVAPPPVSAAVAPPLTFGQLAIKFTPSLISKALPDTTVAATLTALGLTTFNQLMHAPALVPIADAEWSPLVGMAAGVPA